MRLKHNEKKIMALILTPLSFLILGYTMIYLFCQPVIRPLVSIYHLIASDSASKAQEYRVLYDENNVLNQDVVKINSVDWPGLGEMYGKVIIDRVGLNVNLYYGDTEAILYEGAGTYTGAFMPGFGRSIMIAGHTIPYFKLLGEVVVGDVIKISTHYGEFEYRVTNTKIGHYRDSSMYDLEQREKEQLILYTCYPLDGIGFKTERLFVYADKISGPVLEGE